MTIISFSKSSLAPDIEAVVFDKRYHLHSSILRQFSGFFDASLSDTWWKPKNTAFNPVSQSIRYRYELVPDESGDLMLAPVGPNEVHETALSEQLEAIKISSSPSPSTPSERQPTEVNERLAQAHDMLFRIFYLHPWADCQDVDKCLDLIEIADQYCSLPTVMKQVEGRLLSLNNISTILATRPAELINAMIKIQSKPLFHDCIVHLVGLWSVYRHNKDLDLPGRVRRMVEAEYMHILEMKIETDRQLMVMAMPGKRAKWPMTHAVIRRNLKQWFFTRSSKVGVKERTLYQCIEGMDFRPTPSEIGGQNIINPQCGGSELALCARLFRNKALEIVRPLLEDNLQLGNGGSKLEHLTCASCDKYPWDEADT